MDNTQDTPKSPEEFETLIEPEASLPELSLEELPESLRQAVARSGWQSLMPVQAKSLPYLLAGQDLMVQSRTGSGKTGAFLLPILHLLDPSLAQTQALILCPTRELAKQVAMEAETIFKDTALSVVTVYGGVGYGPQNDALRAGAHLVVGTPGRILDHLLRRNFTLDHLKVLVFDEADRMLSIGFYPDMKEIKRYLPRRRVATFLFSATYPPYVLRLAEEFMDHPNFLSLSAKQVHVADILHVYHEVPGMDKDRCLVRLLEIENPVSAIIFSNTKANVHYITEVLKGFGYDAEELSADLSQAKREEVLLRLRKGNLRFLVATDVAARGIDVPELSHVFQYEPPEDPESYVHRAGRTGRAGASGTAITLVNIMEELAIKRIGQRFGIDLIKKAPPTDDDVSAVVAERMTALLEAELRKMPPLKKVRLQRFLPLAAEIAASGDAAPLAMLLDERYQATLHAIPPQPEGAPEEPRRERESRRERPPRKERDKDRDRDRDRKAEPRESREPREPRREPVAAQDEAPEAAPGTATVNAAPAEASLEDAERKKKRRRRRRKKKPSGEQAAAPLEGALPVQDEEEDIYADDSYGFHAKPAPASRPEPAAEDAGDAGAEALAASEDKPKAKPRSRARSKPKSETKSESKAKPKSESKSESKSEEKPAKTVELEYKPDEHKGIEWD